MDRISVVILFDRMGRLLLQERENKPEVTYPGMYAIFGGSVKRGESPSCAAKRELLEELGYRLRNPILFEVYKRDCVQPSPALVYVFYEQITKSGGRKELAEGKAARFVTREQLDRLPMSKLTRRILRDFLKKVLQA